MEQERRAEEIASRYREIILDYEQKALVESNLSNVNKYETEQERSLRQLQRFESLIMPQVFRRRDDWLKSVAEKIAELEEKYEGLADKLAENQSFTTAFLHASEIAMRTHQQEKLTALRNAVLNAALPGFHDDIVQTLFLNLIQDLTTEHIKLLVYYKVNHSLRNQKIKAIDEFKKVTFEKYITNDLIQKGLLLKQSYPKHPNFVGLTAIAKQFLKFISLDDYNHEFVLGEWINNAFDSRRKDETT